MTKIRELTKKERLKRYGEAVYREAYREAYEKAYNRQMKILLEAEKRAVPPPEEVAINEVRGQL